MSAAADLAGTIAENVAVVLVVLGVVPVLASSYQIALASVHALRSHYSKCAPLFPRTAVIIPAWNEGMVLAASIDRLMRMDYPQASLRVYVVDDASTDDTPDVVRAKEQAYPGRVFHLRREHGGQGKAHTLNYGLSVILGDGWMEATLITDADVIFTPRSLGMMTQHLADPDVGAVTAYITEGSRPGNYLTRFIGYEYIAAQAAARRGQNVLGALACLAGGAQLHSRRNLEALGGKIDTTSLAEDTFTTFNTQLDGRKAVFEPHAVVVAEEPGNIASLWKQRLRWARGNFQVTLRYRHVWFRRRSHGLGGYSFGLIWFGLFFQPILMILASVGLVFLFLANPHKSAAAFAFLWIVTALTFVLTTTLTLLIDTHTARHVWREAIMFPGLVSLLLILTAIFPIHVEWASERVLALIGVSVTSTEIRVITLLIYAWPALSMVSAYFARLCDNRAGSRWLSPILVMVVGYGPLLCAIGVAAYVKELRGADMKWEKTDKTGVAQG